MAKGDSNKVGFWVRFKKFLTKKNIFMAILVVVLLFQYWQSKNNSANFSFLHTRESSLIEEIGQLQETYMNVGDDLNEIRLYLRLPTKQYEELELNLDNEDGDKNKDQVQLALFQYIDHIASTKSIQEKLTLNKALLDNLIISKDFSKFLIGEKLAFAPTIRDENNVVVKINDKDGNALITYTFDNKTGDLIFQTISKKEPVDTDDFVEFKQNLITFLTDNKTDLIASIQTAKKLQEAIVGAINSAKVQDIIKRRELSFAPNFTQKDLKITYSIFNKADELVGEIVLNTENLEISLVDKNDSEMKLFVTDMMISLPPFLNNLDARTFIEQKASNAIDSFRNTLNDKGFKLLLSSGGLYFTEPKEDEDRIYYMLYDKKDILVSTFTLEKATGVVTVTDSDGNKNENLLFFDPDLKKKP